MELKDNEPQITQLNVDSEKLKKYSLIVQVNTLNETYRNIRSSITKRINDLQRSIEIHHR